MGIVAGVASIIAVMTGISVVQVAMEQEMSVLGTQTFQVQKWPRGNFRNDVDWRKIQKRKPVTVENVNVVREKVSTVDLVGADAADWVEARLAEPQAAGVTRVLMHSVVWQYLPEPTAERIRAAMKAAGARATVERPLGWVMMEPDRALGMQVIRARSWPGDGDWQTLATSHAHRTWLDTGLGEDKTPAAPLPEAAKIRV